MTIGLTSRASIKGVIAAARDGGDATYTVDAGHVASVGTGVGANQATGAYRRDFTIAASGTLDIDLSGTLVSALGDALVFTAIKEILLTAAAGNTNNVVLGAATNPFIGPFGAGMHTLAVKPGQRFNATDYSAAGWPVVAGTGDILRLTNSAAGTPVSGTIVIVGETA